MSEYSDITALVTGGAAGIGRATATELARRGASVACLDLHPEQAPPGSAGLFCDVTDDASVLAAVAEVEARFGGVDVVVNNAGIGAVGTVADNPDDEWRRVLDTNLLGMVRVSRAALPALRRSPTAAIVNVGSIAASTGLTERALYSATKGAVQALTLAMAADHIRDGIKVNCVNPGTADTDWVNRLLAAAADPIAARTALLARQPTGRLVSPAEIALAICHLAAPADRSTTGTILAVDGGSHALRLPPR